MTENFKDDNTNGIRAIHNPQDALEYLKNPKHFCLFSLGLTDLMQKYGYPGSKEDVEERTEYLWKRFASIENPPQKATVRNWFRHEQKRPSMNSISRTHMFQICFALSVSLEDADDFFNYVYLGRSFNCHTMEEAVYYYCFSNQLTYGHAQKLIRTIKCFPDTTADSTDKPIFTRNIIERLKQCRSDEAFLYYFQRNNHIFRKWNRTASEHIQCRVSEIRGNTSDKRILRACQNMDPISLKEFIFKELDHCSLVIREYLIHKIQKRPDDISGQTITSINFILERMLLTQKGIPKGTDLPAGIRVNFPRGITFSEILHKSETSISYDSIRKCLILLEFYHFWVCTLQAEILKKNVSPVSDTFERYREKTRYVLLSCGYGDLFPGNPYDWLFLWASTTENPLDSLRSVMDGILEEAF